MSTTLRDSKGRYAGSRAGGSRSNRSNFAMRARLAVRRTVHSPVLKNTAKIVGAAAFVGAGSYVGEAAARRYIGPTTLRVRPATSGPSGIKGRKHFRVSSKTGARRL